METRQEAEQEEEQDILLREHLEAVDAALEQARAMIREFKRQRFPLASSTRAEEHDGA